MAKRIIEIEGRLASVDLGLNLGPDIANAVKPDASNQEITWDTPWLGVGANTSFLLMTEAWIYVSSLATMVPYRNLNSSAGLQDSFEATLAGAINWNFDIGGNFGPAHFDVSLPSGTFPNNQWVHILQASDMTSVNLGSRIFEHVVNGILVPPSSRTTSTLNNNQNGFANPHAFFHDVFLTTSPSAGGRIWMIQDFLDITDTGNVDKFIDRLNYRPMQLGPDGSIPTGNVPILFMQNTIVNITDNLGGERDSDSIDGTWEDAGHNPTSPARFAHNTGASGLPGIEMTNTALGLTDTQQFSLSMWFKTPFTIAPGNLVIASDASNSNRLIISYDSSGNINVEGRDSSGTLIIDSTATTGNVSTISWHHIAVSINMQAAVAADAVRMFVDDADALPSTSTFVGSASINLGQTGLVFAVLNHIPTTLLTGGEFSQFWCASNTFVDFANATIRAKFVQTTTVPIPIALGDTGELPLGVSPTIFTGEGPTFVESTPLFNVNRGSAGGTFTITRGPWLAPTSNPAVDQLGN